MYVYVCVCTCCSLPVSSECYQDECVPYVQHVSTDPSVKQGEKMEAHSCLHQSMGDWASQTWGEKKKKFLGGGDRWELRKVFFGEEGMDGNNILSVVSASPENYLLTTNIYSSLSYFISFCFCVPLLHIPAIHSHSLSFFAVSLCPSPSTLPHPCVLWHLSWHSGEPAFCVLDLSHVMLTCYVLQVCSAAKGPLRKRAAITSSRKQSTARRGERLCLCVRGLCGWVEVSGSRISRDGTPL